MTINLVTVLVAAAVNFFIGFMFHGPIGGKMWMKLANIVPTGKEKFSDMVPQMVKSYFMNVVAAYVLGVLIVGTGVMGVYEGMMLAFMVWLGFIVTSSSMDVIWMKGNVKLWLYECGVALLSFLAMGAILAN